MLRSCAGRAADPAGTATSLAQNIKISVEDIPPQFPFPASSAELFFSAAKNVNTTYYDRRETYKYSQDVTINCSSTY